MGKRAHRRLVEQGQEALELGRDDTRLNHLQQRSELGVAFRWRVQRRGDAMNGIVGKRKLATGINLDRIGIADRLTSRRNHMANTVELVAKELHAHGRRGLRGIDVHGIAVHVEIARFGRRIGRRVAHGHKTCGHLLKRNLVAHGKGRGLPIAALARGYAAQQGTSRSHKHACLATSDTPKRSTTRGHHNVVWLLVFPGVIRALGEASHMLAAQIGHERSCCAIGRLLARNHIYAGARMPSKLRGKHKSARRERHGKRRILTVRQRLLDDLQAFGSMELCSYAMNEHRSVLTFKTKQRSWPLRTRRHK